MKYINNQDLDLKIELTGYTFNPSIIKIIDIAVYTTSVFNYLRKSHLDVDQYNFIHIDKNELALLQDGQIKYNITVVENTGKKYSEEVTTDYYYTHQNTSEESLLDNYYTKLEADDKFEKKGNYVTDAEIADMETATHASDTYQLKGDYAVKSDLTSKADKVDIPSKLSDLTNDMQFISFIPTEYITEAELNKTLEGKNYIQEHQDVSNKVNREELNNYQIKGDYVTQESLNARNFVGHEDLAGLPTTSDIAKINDVLSTKADQDDIKKINNSLSLKADKTELSDFASQSSLNIISQQVDNIEKASISNSHSIDNINKKLMTTVDTKQLDKTLTLYVTTEEFNNVLGETNTKINNIKNLI